MTSPTQASAGRAGRLYGVGVGPGDPELVTLKAQRLIAAADVVAFPIARRSTTGGVARTIAAPHMADGVIEVPMVYPITIEESEHPGGYEAAIVDFYDASAAALAVHLDAGRDVVVLCEGDPFFYGSYMYLHERLAGRYVTEVVPGVTSFSAASAATGTPLVKRDDVLEILPGTLPPDVLAARLRAADAAVVMKLGRTFGGVRDAAESAGVAAESVYVERASAPAQRSAPLRDVDAGTVPYMSLVLVPTTWRSEADTSQAASAGPSAAAVPDGGVAPSSAPAPASPGPGPGRVSVVGLGPAGAEWLTPEAASVLASADVIVGYQTYVDRVPVRPGQERFATDNRVETERARHALELAAGGRHVAVVSSGDPGIFAMAAAVLEILDGLTGDPLAAVEVDVVPGLSAMQAAAARVGAPLGHDFAVISLSDILKPWPVVERRLAAAAAADFALALYNPASKTRREQLERAVAVLREHRAPDTPVVVARAVGDPAAEAVTVTSLGALDPSVVDMRTLLIVGSSQTRTIAATGQVYTPRSHPG